MLGGDGFAGHPPGHGEFADLQAGSEAGHGGRGRGRGPAGGGEGDLEAPQVAAQLFGGRGQAGISGDRLGVEQAGEGRRIAQGPLQSGDETGPVGRRRGGGRR
ncbi:hypothetical protein CGZ95_21020 [Enemella evansiae]|nr:hypothetical protein CGZ95_21020 [Enemella evansiae]